jgi:hypothetical protein
VQLIRTPAPARASQREGCTTTVYGRGMPVHPVAAGGRGGAANPAFFGEPRTLRAGKQPGSF